MHTLNKRKLKKLRIFYNHETLYFNYIWTFKFTNNLMIVIIDNGKFR